VELDSSVDHHVAHEGERHRCLRLDRKGLEHSLTEERSLFEHGNRALLERSTRAILEARNAEWVASRILNPWVRGKEQHALTWDLLADEKNHRRALVGDRHEPRHLVARRTALHLQLSKRASSTGTEVDC